MKVSNSPRGTLPVCFATEGFACVGDLTIHLSGEFSQDLPLYLSLFCYFFCLSITLRLDFIHHLRLPMSLSILASSF